FPPATNPISRLKYAAVDRFFAVSSAVRAALEAAGIEAERIGLLPDGLPPEAFVSAPPPPAPPYRVAHVGSFDGKKGQDVVVEVVARLAREGWNLEAVFLGDGPERARVEEQARQANVASRCTFLGVVSDVPVRLASSHLLLLPSESEGASLALLEAMAAGCAVLTHEVGGAREVVDGGKAGRLLPDLDPETWTAATRDLLSNEEERRRLVEAGRRFVAPRTVETTAEALEGEFRALVAAKRR
ncbi:MAG TPA: glycosyltransferase, partial [Thermoanaerobaculia bacterium]|nr:glycosyltransferase [Thermoanaerobaculia bacterium]